MDSTRVCIEEGIILTSREDHALKLESHRIGNVMWSRWITNPVEKAAIADGGSVLVAQVCGQHSPNPVLPWITSSMGPMFHHHLEQLTKAIGNGWSPHLLEPQNGKELCMLTLPREHWESFFMLVQAFVETVGSDRGEIVLATIENLKKQLEKKDE